MNYVLEQIFEFNPVVFYAFALVGVVSFFLYTFRGEEHHSNTFACVLPVTLWILVEYIVQTMGYAMPIQVSVIAGIVSLACIALMVFESVRHDRTPFAILNILGNLFVMYAAPTVLYGVLAVGVITIGGAAILIVGIPLLILAWFLSDHRD